MPRCASSIGGRTRWPIWKGTAIGSWPGLLREIGITPRQRKVIEARPRLSGRSLDRQSRAAIRRRQVWAHKKGKVLAVEELWGERIDAARQDMANAREHLAAAVREALDLWREPAIFERRTGFTRQRACLS